MREIEKLKSIPVTDEEVFKKVNELVDAVNQLIRNSSIYTPIRPYDTNFMNKIRKK